MQLVPVVSLLLFACSANALESFTGYEGIAYELGNGKMIYKESHFLRVNEARVTERVVLYRCPNGKPFARKLLTISAAQPLVPRFELIDARRGYREGLKENNGQLEVFYQLSQTKKRKHAQVKQTAALVADAGFDDFVRKNWTALVAGESVKLDFVVPSQLDYLGFKVKLLRTEQMDGAGVRVFKLAPSGVLGWVTSGIDVTYTDADRQLRRFEGLSNIRDNAGENYEAKIDFPVNLRQPKLDAAAFEAAKTVSLAKLCN